MTAVLDEPPRIPREVPDWHQAAACRLFPELRDWWHDAKPGSVEEIAARAICAACPVRLQCAAGALERREPYGIWGGLDRQDRKRIAARFGFAPPGDPPAHGTNSRRVKWNCDCPECKGAHALYEAMRRERKRAERLAAELWRTPIVLGAPARAGRVRVLPGQLLLPLPVASLVVAAAA